ncbi:beta-glucuronidase isoform X1 [Bemisia tabaci]|uniref:beta-glucuronidase isoform X1 n=1 Tax=Bemisia tabaci TaxID=7038 RepID=UPI0008F9B8C0|nr:PREDICTED: beta-glucuronidase-like isoform X1 [Bemisia tabaci]XP_018896914.1 PREDICTED: beta-glucuronidase-like isoform X1 [Bemisia tabaci]XP_018896922.1 PREDICTED: beta-glucuronidase-like isoform X1 [Bemisia tabaci]
MQWFPPVFHLARLGVLLHLPCVFSGGILYPRESPTREVKSLDGIWNFKLSKPDHFSGFHERWYHTDLAKTGGAIPMPVPSSYNDITTDSEIHDHVGLVWYDRTFFVPDRWRLANNRVWLRFGGVHYACQVWINGHSVMSHEIGHLPFQHEVTSLLAYGTKNRITVVVDNTLLLNTIPQGQVEPIDTPEGKKQQQTYTFDFFNYAGIQRPVFLYTTPAIYIEDISILTDIADDGTTGIIKYNVSIGGLPEYAGSSIKVYADLITQEGTYASRSNPSIYSSTSTVAHGVLKIKNAKLWWPYLMHPSPGYLYSIEFRVINSDSMNPVEDIYVLPVGIRSLSWSNTTFMINNKPIYMRGFGRHEDSAIRGKGVDLPLITRDYNLIKWIGANSYRTSHYPYAEEIMDFADQQGIMIIDECPAVDTNFFSDVLLTKHKESLRELIQRDKNRPSVIMWSVTNEPQSSDQKADAYFRSITKFVKTLDKTRPITAAINRWYTKDRAAQHLDIIGFNRYIGWYSNTGQLYEIKKKIITEAQNWHRKHNKPVYMTEYGADSVGGIHTLPVHVWSERYQTELIAEYFKAFDHLRNSSFYVGEMIWNFADFETEQSVRRVSGNKKGLFTRDRQPKEAAYLVRKRYFELAAELDGAGLPRDLEVYTISKPSPLNTNRIEL